MIISDTRANSSVQFKMGLSHIITAFLQGVCWSDVRKEGSGLKSFTREGRSRGQLLSTAPAGCLQALALHSCSSQGELHLFPVRYISRFSL